MDGQMNNSGNDGELWDNPLELQGYLPYRLAVTYNLVSRAFATQCRETTGLSIPEWRVLAVLGRQRAALTSQDVVHRTAMDKAKVSRAVSSLVDKALIRRDGDAYDHRLNRLTLTDGGEEVYRTVVPMALELERRLTDSISEEEMTTFNALLERLQHAARGLVRG